MTVSNRQRCLGIAIVLGLLLAGCAAPKPKDPEKADESRDLLVQSLARRDQQPAHTASADAKKPIAQPTGANVSISYVGDARDLLRQVAAARGLVFEVRGPQPHLPLFVIVEARNKAFEEVLGDVASQFGQRADLALTDRSIEVRYRD